VSIVAITSDRIVGAAAALSRAMLDEPGGRWLLPDEAEFLAVHEQLYVATMTQAMDVGRVDAWGEPFVGVALWLERPAIGEASAPPPGDVSDELTFPEHAAERIEEADRLIQLMRKRARPDRHIYLDSIGVLPDHRGKGIATRLLEVGFVWADAEGLPISLDTLDDGNVAFYERRGFEVVASESVVGAILTVTSMRRPVGMITP
jgi:GNAT superfamily N-acetyltransferase